MIVEKLSTIHMNSQKRRKSSKKKKKTIIVTIKILDINKLGGRNGFALWQASSDSPSVRPNNYLVR